MSMYGGYPTMPMPGSGSHGGVRMPYPPGPGFGGALPTSTASQMDREMQALIGDLKALLRDAGIEELKELNNDETKIINLIEDSTQVQQLKAKRQQSLSENRDLAALNLSLKPEMEINREKLATICNQQSVLKQEYDRLQERIRQLSGNYSLEDTLAKLKVAAAQMEDETEGLSQKMLDKDIEFDDFLDTYISKRTVYHARRIKTDKMAEIVMKTPSNYYGSGYGRY